MPLDFSDDHFSLLALPKAFALDLASLDGNYRKLQTEVHPDRFANGSDADRRRSVQWSAHVNEAYQTLKRPLSRAVYLLSLNGARVDAENNTAMSPEFLMQQMSLREALDDARSGGDMAALEALHIEMANTLASGYRELAALLDEKNDYPAATELVRKQMFLERMAEQLDDAIAECE